MAADLEQQLLASLPGRSTEVAEYAMLAVARKSIADAIRLIREARPMVAVVLGNDRQAVELLSAADIEASKAVLDLDRAIKAHPAGRVPR